MEFKISKYLGNKKLIPIILFAFILRITLFVIAQPWTLEVEQNRIVRSDAIGYNELAKSIINDFSFEFGRKKNSFRTPGYPIFLAIIYSIFGVKPYIVLIFQIIINIFSILILYEIAKKIFSKKIALISSFLFSIDPHTILYTCELFTETFFTFIILLTFMCFVNAINTKEIKYFILTALFLGFSTLVRMKEIRHKLSIKAKEKGAVFSHWTTNNAKTFNNVKAYQEVSKDYIKNNILSFSLVHFKNSILVFFNVGTKGIMSMFRIKEIELPNMAAASLIENIINIIKLKSSSEILLIIIIAILFLIIYTLTFIGIIDLFQQKKYFILILILGFIIYFAITLGANGNAARFKLPIIPFYSLIASVGIIRVGKYMKSRKNKAFNLFKK